MSRVSDNNPYVYLANNGPATDDELPNSVKSSDKSAGVARFDITNGRRGGNGVYGGGPSTSVYYIEGKHDKETVIEKWIDENQSIIEEISGWSLIHKCPRDFQVKFSRKIDYTHPKHGPNGKRKSGGPTQQSCPYCGDGDIYNLPSHLPCDETPENGDPQTPNGWIQDCLTRPDTAIKCHSGDLDLTVYYVPYTPHVGGQRTNEAIWIELIPEMDHGRTVTENSIYNAVRVAETTAIVDESEVPRNE